MLKWSKYRKSDDMPPIAVEQIIKKETSFMNWII